MGKRKNSVPRGSPARGSPGRGRGRGRGGGGGGARGGGTGPGPNPPHTGRWGVGDAFELLQSVGGSYSPHRGGGGGYGAARGGGRGARGGGRGRGRGGALAMTRQNAVGFDYSQLTYPRQVRRNEYGESLDAGDTSRRQDSVRPGADGGVAGRNGRPSTSTAGLGSGGRGDGEEEDEDDDEDDDSDIVLEPPPGYRHKARPPTDDEEPADDFDPDAAAPSRPEEHVVIDGGVLADAIPRAPKAMLTLSGGTFQASLHQRRFARPTRARALEFPAFVTSRGPEGAQPRAPEAGGEDHLLAGIPGRTRTRPTRPIAAAQVAFVAARGDWVEGKWTGKKGEGVEVLGIGVAGAGNAGPSGASAAAGEQPGQPGHAHHAASSASHRPGAGLGFVAATNAQAEQDEEVTARGNDDAQGDGAEYDEAAAAADEDGDDIVRRLLLSFPGSRELEEQETFTALDVQRQLGRDGFGGQRPEGITSHDALTGPTDGVSDERDAVAPSSTSDAPAVPRAPEEDCSEEDEDEEILIPSAPASPEQVQASAGPRSTNSDSEEERQLDAIIATARSEAAREGVELDGEAMGLGDANDTGEEGFFIDLSGDTSPPEVAQFSASTRAYGAAIGEGAQHTSPPPPSSLAQQRRDLVVDEHVAPAPPSVAVASSKRTKNGRGRRGKQARDVPVPREGDSDVEWGSAGPPDDEELEAEGQRGLSLRGVASGRRRGGGARRRRRQRDEDEEAALADYLENVLGREAARGGSDGDEDEEAEEGGAGGDDDDDMAALIAFARGMDANDGGREVTLGDIEDESMLREEDEWMTESDDDDEGSASGGDGAREGAGAESDSRRDEAVATPADGDEQRGSEDRQDEEDESSSDESETRVWAAMGVTREDEDEDSTSSSDDDEEDEDEKLAWDVEEEAFMRTFEQFTRGDDASLSKKERKRLFKAIERGDFSVAMQAGLEDEDLLVDGDIDLDDFAPVVSAGSARKRNGGGAKGGKLWGDADLFADELQVQWEKDRAAKAEKKKRRAADRQLAAQTLHGASSGMSMVPGERGRNKKAAKKLAKKARRAERLESMLADAEDADAMAPQQQQRRRFAPTNLAQLDVEIRAFLLDAGRSALSLPPMDKHARAQVHMLANAYSLKSKSHGAGRARFPTLIKVRLSGKVVDEARVRSLLSGGRGSFGLGSKGGGGKGWGGGRSFTSWDERGGGGGGGGAVAVAVPRNQEGAAVGWGAERIGVDNVGHRLLSMMGWREGTGVGARASGIAEPIGATIKVTKGGLGF